MATLINTFLETVQNWPIILQGALGAALFATVLKIGERLYIVVAFAISRLSRQRRLSYLRNRYIRLDAKRSGDLLSQSYFISVLWYRASREVIKALMWLTLGLFFTNIVGVWGAIGYLGCLYYLFFAFHVVRPISGRTDELDQEIEKVKAAIAEIETLNDA